MPIYLVTTPQGEKLVEAHTKAQAINHVTRTTITAKTLTASEAVTLMKNGTTVETAAATEAEPAQTAEPKVA